MSQNPASELPEDIQRELDDLRARADKLNLPPDFEQRLAAVEKQIATTTQKTDKQTKAEVRDKQIAEAQQKLADLKSPAGHKKFSDQYGSDRGTARWWTALKQAEAALRELQASPAATGGSQPQSAVDLPPQLRERLEGSARHVQYLESALAERPGDGSILRSLADARMARNRLTKRVFGPSTAKPGTVDQRTGEYIPGESWQRR